MNSIQVTEPAAKALIDAWRTVDPRKPGNGFILKADRKFLGKENRLAGQRPALPVPTTTERQTRTPTQARGYVRSPESNPRALRADLMDDNLAGAVESGVRGGLRVSSAPLRLCARPGSG